MNIFIDFIFPSPGDCPNTVQYFHYTYGQRQWLWWNKKPKMANKTNFFIICPASFKPLSVLFYFFIHPVVAVLCLCVHLCARILANIQIFNFTPKPMISSLHFHKSPKVCIIISLALVTGGYLCWGHSECRHSHEAERRGRKKKHI